MNWTNGLSWWASLKARRAERRDAANDHGDMGTAFGLDASFGPVEDAPPMAPGVLPAPSSLPWEYRLTRRSGL